MFLDKRSEFCDAAALNMGAAGTYLIGNVMDIGMSGLDLGQAGNFYLVIQVSTTATSAGNATATFKLCSDTQAAIATNGTAKTHIVTETFTLAGLNIRKTVYAAPLPRGVYDRYLGLLQVTGTAAFTAGGINAFLTTDPNGWRAYPDASY